MSGDGTGVGGGGASVGPGGRLRVVFAPDSFKGTVAAADAADALARGWRAVRPGDEVVLRPMADGGEGTLDAFAAAVAGARRMPVQVAGPDSRPAASSWVLLPDGTGVVELAATSGITMLDPLLPLDAHTVGFGQAIAAALDHGVDRLLLGLGGSATSDGGGGALEVLGARFADAAGEPIPRGNRGLGVVASADLSGLRPLPRGGAVVLGDVTNPLLGPSGAAAVFGPQKGADAATVDVLEANLARLAGLLPAVDPETPGTGAAGGTGFAMLAWGAELGGGAELIARIVGLPEAVRGASLVITGEGRYDGQSEAGKAPTEVAGIAERAGVPVALVAGAITADATRFAASASLSELAGDGAAAMADGPRWLAEAGAVLARTLGATLG
ncbi:glycerate kinase [Agromyces sp. NPDC058110]|uniref:glycerate kinase n=1 Tax=Agromyces sp. NPDC058110 TaxID=3346345 RepID=UPI0036DB5275